MQSNALRPLFSQQNIYRVCFVLLTLSLSCSLFINAYPKKIFYAVSYIVLFFFVVQGVKKRLLLDKSALCMAGALLLIGAVRVVWSRLFEHAAFGDVIKNYYDGGKLFMVAALVFYFIFAWRHYLNRQLLQCCLVLLLAGIVVTLGFALHEHHQTHQRVKLLTDSAGTVSYIITAVAFTALFISHQVINGRLYQLLLLALIFCLNMALMILTESRAAIITLPLLYFIYFALTHRWAGKVALVAILVLLAISVVVLPHSIWERLDSIRSEIATYQTNNDTSIGARFSIWKGGFNSTSWGLMGQSPDDRTSKARQYIERYERGNPEAWNNVKYHLHDDFLETLSLQGIAGALSLLLFYLAMLLLPVKRHARWLVVLPISIIIFGLTDTVLIQTQTVLILMMALIISYALTETSRNSDPRS